MTLDEVSARRGETMKEEDRAILEELYDLWVQQGEHRAVVDRIAAVEAEDPRQATYLAI